MIRGLLAEADFQSAAGCQPALQTLHELLYKRVLPVIFDCSAAARFGWR
jgi:hypothetical protein